VTANTNGTDGAASTPRQRILEAAVDLFHREGYYATSLRQLADAVGLQVGSLYNHIDSKEALLGDIMRTVLVELIEETEREMAAAGERPVARVRAFLRTSIRFHAERRKETFIGNTELRGLDDANRREIVALRDRYELMLREALEAGVTAGELEIPDVQLATLAALAICTNVAVWYRPDGRLSLEEVQELLPRTFGPLCPVLPPLTATNER
jgi:AcrR family transcriptional regulator